MQRRRLLLVVIALLCGYGLDVRAGLSPDAAQSPKPASSTLRHTRSAGPGRETVGFVRGVDRSDNFDTGVPAQASGTAVGAQPTLVLLVNFLDNTSEPTTPAEIEDLVFSTSNPDSLNARVEELSYGRAWLTGDVTD